MPEPSDDLYADWWEQTRGLCERCDRRPGEISRHGAWVCCECADEEDEMLEVVAA